MTSIVIKMQYVKTLMAVMNVIVTSDGKEMAKFVLTLMNVAFQLFATLLTIVILTLDA